MCGIIAIKDSKNIKKELFSALCDLKHRGEDAWGISFLKKEIIVYKKLGKIKNKYINLIQDKFNLAIGYTRYKTQGGSSLNDTQPAIYKNNISMIHNGNITNRKELEKILDKSKFGSKNDVELILYLFINYIKDKNSVNDIFDAVTNTQKKLNGAYSVLSIFNGGLLAFKDPNGIRPLVLGKKDNSYAFASESIALENIGYKIIKELKAKEIIYIDKNNQLFSSLDKYNDKNDNSKNRFCVFEYIYFSKPETILHNKKVKLEREKMGKIMANIFKEKGLVADFVIPIPQTAYYASKGFSEELDIPLKEIFIKKKNIDRTFILPNQKTRIEKIKDKFDFNLNLVKDKKIVLLDDSIVRGNTTKHLLSLLKDAKAKKVYLISASPMIKSQCFYGIDISTKEELIANNRTLDEIKEFIGVDELIYLPLNVLNDFYKNLGICTDCFL